MERAAAQQVEVEMRNGLAGVAAAVDDDAIATLEHTQFGRDLTRRDEHFAQQLRIFRNGLTQAGNYAFRHDQHMHRRLRIHVAKREKAVMVEDDLSRNLLRGYFLKYSHRKNCNLSIKKHHPTQPAGGDSSFRSADVN